MSQLTSSAKQTFNLAKNFAKKLGGGEVIGLIGELGAGKTVFVKGLATGLGIKKNITSPTFVLMKIYPVTNFKFQISNFVHIDAYRIKNEKDVLSIGAEEYFNQLNTVTVIEWADKIKKILPLNAVIITLKNKGKNTRQITIK
jgi:tRNA threonylcarbamoyladenosine biosynthesis protein TsaE